MTKYRRSRNAAANAPWHFSRDCSDDPKSDYDVRYDQPCYADLCYQCKTGRIEALPASLEIKPPFPRWLPTEPLRPVRPLRRYFEAA